MRTLGFVSDSDLAVLYRRATALVMPSTYEGFGLPVLEAMRLGGPVICARATIKAFEDALSFCGASLSGWPRGEDVDAGPSSRLQGRAVR